MSEKNYKETLNLPKTAFPMKADLVKREPERLAKWEADRSSLDKAKDALAVVLQQIEEAESRSLD